MSIGTMYDEEVQVLENGKFALPCNVCCTQIEADTDMSQQLSCGHIYVQLNSSKHKAKFPSKMDEMVFRMKAVMQGNEDSSNKRAVDAYYELNDKFMQKYKSWKCYMVNGFVRSDLL